MTEEGQARGMATEAGVGAFGLSSYHTHTVWSDGRAGTEAMVRAAESAGLAEIGISDHYVPVPEGVPPCSWSMPLTQVAAYVADVRAAARGASIPVRVGVEADYFPATVRATAATLAALDVDYVIGSVHFAGPFPVDESAALWQRLSPVEIDAVYARYWQCIREMAEAGCFDVVGHLDLPKKFGFRADGEMDDLIVAALDAVAAADMAVELNTSGWDKPCRACYPDVTLLRQCVDRGIPVVPTADAHGVEEVDRHFGRARALLLSLGCTTTVRWCERARQTVPL